ncbi:uroporphyrinogen-III synthase [Natrarchaeobius halalkaliphilus]|uniref:Uroporphyrinogen-III synthase n=1 Tax=Natrarchaeobius halalkaliphilus TaxID=1679091 RepID=A0A3N6LMT0_9EURY|nr:uroporphyrinogen-III synthase [Natrarchaeobius halalkaliphilus]RQG89157.1 uroporphyrinogen-III synthase [Natrarchaeobius halalkaliphilus]
MSDQPTVAVFRPDDERLAEASALLESLGADPIVDPMLAVEPTDETPRTDAEYTIFTSKTGAELVADAGWERGETTVCAIGTPTASALERVGYAVDLVPEEFTSSGLVAALDGSVNPRIERDERESDAERRSANTPRETVEGARVEVARSDHGSDVLLEGLEAAGAYVHETVLYRLVRPEGSGESAERAAGGGLDAACFTSSLTVDHFLESAADRGIRDEALSGLANATVGVIGDPTRETAESQGIDVDVVAEEATFDALARETLEAL